jgi:hypothetical protein
MSINYIPNDPRAGSTAPAIRVKSPRGNRASTRSGFTFSNTSPQGVFAPGTAGFLFWQCREAAIAAVQAWETSAGPHTKWQGNRKKLPLHQDEGQDLNAFYNRQTFSFFHQTFGGTTFFSGASTDVVAHEVGHGLLDSVRPDFFSVNFLEVGALHEAFGDCMALLTGLADNETRVKLLAAASDLRKKNFLESTAEDLSEGIRRFNPNHNAAEPRHAFNKFQFQIPSTLPSTGGPGKLINEVHSFGMLFSGCFWDVIANIFAAGASHNEAALASAAALAGKILIAGVKGAVITPRFLQSVGRAMVLADESLHGGANRDHIRDAFQAHNILLGANAMIAPSMLLDGAAPKGKTLSPATHKDLKARLGAVRGAKMSMAAADLFGAKVINVLNTREISLGGIDKDLKGVVGIAHEPVNIGASGGRAAVMGAMPQPEDTDKEVIEFVKALLEHDRIDLGKKKQATGASRRSLVAGRGAAEGERSADGKKQAATHTVKSVGGKKVLTRIRFHCGGPHHC